MGAVSNDLHIDGLLSEFAMGYRPEGFIADMIFPMVQVGKQSNLYPVFDRGDRLRIDDTRRAPGTQAKRVTENVGSATYYANNYALAASVTIEDKVNADPLLVNLTEEGKVRLCMDKLLLDWEDRVERMVSSGSNVGSYTSVASAWNGAGDPLGDVNTIIDNVRYANGVSKKGMTVKFGPKAWDSFRRDSNVRNLIFGTNNGGGYPSEEQVANVLDVRRILISGAFKNTADEGQSESLEPVGNDDVLVYYSPESPTIDMPSFGYSIRWVGAGLPNMMVERHAYDTRTKSEDVEVGYYQDEKITGASYGMLLESVNSST